MNDAIAIIKDEHRSMAAVVKGLQTHIAAVREGREPADYHLFLAMFDYIESVPDRLHHPKEDEYLFRFLRLRSAQAVPVLDQLEAEHIEARELLSGLRMALEQFRKDGSLDALGLAVDAYANFLWVHMQKEEEVIIPMAETALTEQDWQTITTAFQANRNLAW